MNQEQKDKAVALAENTDKSWRQIARDLELPKSTVSDFLREYKKVSTDAGPKILLFDIETAPAKYYQWSRWQKYTGQSMVISEGYMLSWSAKWLGSESIMSDAIWDHDGYKKNPEDDSNIVKSLHALIDEADIIIGHNGNRFDIPILYTRCLLHGFQPPHSSKYIDTLKIAKRVFRFPSNKLGDLAIFLGLTEKVDTGGFELWKKCLEGDKDAQSKMVLYNEQDVDTLEQLYLTLRPWDHKHPNLSLYYEESDVHICVACASPDLKKTGKKAYTGVSVFETYRCNDCHKINRVRQSSLSKGKRKKVLTNVAS